jgi:hypothetical protein
MAGEEIRMVGAAVTENEDEGQHSEREQPAIVFD